MVQKRCSNGFTSRLVHHCGAGRLFRWRRARFRSGARAGGIFRQPIAQAQLADFLAQLGGHLEELFGGNESEVSAGQLLLDSLLQPGQAGQFHFVRGEDFLLQGLDFHGAESANLAGAFFAPSNERSFADVDFGGDPGQAPALSAQFDEFILGFVWVHTDVLFAVLDS